MFSIDECWEILESQLDDPSILPNGAKEEAIVNAERTLGFSLPEDYRQFLLRHDGSEPFFIFPYKIGGGGQGFMSLTNLLFCWEHLVQSGIELEKRGQAGEQTGPVKPHVWNRQWVPFTDNECGDHLFLDLDPAEEGAVGQVVDWWHERAQSTYQAAGLKEWLNEVVQEIRNGVYHFGDEM